MRISVLRDELLQARAQAAAGDTPSVVRTLDQALRELGPERLLTPAQAAALLDVHSVNVVKYWCRSGFLKAVRRNDRILIPLSEVERIQESEGVRDIRIADAYHAASEQLGTTEGLDDAQLQALAASRPGTLPWRQ